jgi:hypothetical protein
VVDSLIDGGKALAIDASSIDEWALGLWQEAGRSEAQYRRFRAAVDSLEHGAARELLVTLQP